MKETTHATSESEWVEGIAVKVTLTCTLLDVHIMSFTKFACADIFMPYSDVPNQ